MAGWLYARIGLAGETHWAWCLRASLMPALALTRAVLMLPFLAAALPAHGAEIGPVSRDADFTARQITEVLYKFKGSDRPDFSGHDLTYLDLSELDFKGATLARSDLYGTDFTAANLSGADLSNTRLDRAVLIRANLSGAKLTGATIFRPTIYSDMNSTLTDAPRFAGANLQYVRLQADLSGADFRGADLSHAKFSPLEVRPGEGTLVTMRRNVLKSCNFAGALMLEADFRMAILHFSRFTGADLKSAQFSGADLSMTDFSGADVTGVDFSGADLDGANFVGAKGFETVLGLDTAINVDRMRR
ncbi:MAG: pentapeptide repeat-containing protein [Hyphomicrobium sp.]